MGDAISYLQIVMSSLSIPILLIFSIGLALVLADGIIKISNPFRR